jgi:hypothetical protein
MYFSVLYVVNLIISKEYLVAIEAKYLCFIPPNLLNMLLYMYDLQRFGRILYSSLLEDWPILLSSPHIRLDLWSGVSFLKVFRLDLQIYLSYFERNDLTLDIKKKYSVFWVREKTERPPLFGEVSVNFDE